MALFPDSGPPIYDDKDSGIKKQMEDFYQNSISNCQEWWGQCRIDSRFENGDQALWSELYQDLPMHRRKAFNFNRIRPIINMISGYQRRNRKSTVVIPIENGDSKTADQFTKIIMWANQYDNVLGTISEAFNGAIISGMNLLQVWMDYRTDPICGNMRVDNCSYDTFLIDPFFKKQDLSDCNAIWKRRLLSKKECISFLPEEREAIESLSSKANDTKFEYMPENYDLYNSELLTYDEYYYRDFRKQKLIIDSETGETKEWRSDNSDRLQDFLTMYPNTTVVEHEIPTVRLAIVVQGQVFYNDINPLGIDSYPFVPVMAYFSPDIPFFYDRVQGVVRGLRDPQYLYTRRKIAELAILDSQVSSGIKYKPSALVDPKDAFLSGEGRSIALKEDALMSDVEQIMPPQIPPSMFQLSEILAREINTIAGVNEELMGQAVDDKAGILAMLRQGAGLTTLQRLFDLLDFSQKILGAKQIEIIQNSFTADKVRRIIAEEPSPEFYDKNFGRYDAAIEEGINTTTQKQVQFAQLLHLKSAGIPIPDEAILDATTIQGKQELIETIKASREKAEQAQQQQSSLQQQQLQAQVNAMNSQSVADQGLGLERLSRIQENQQQAIERSASAEEARAKAQTDKTVSLLNITKALQEIEEVDLRSLEKLIALSKMLKETQLSEPASMQQPMAPMPSQESQLGQEGLIDRLRGQQFTNV